MNAAPRYIGTLTNVHKKYAWIKNVRTIDGSAHTLDTDKDIFAARDCWRPDEPCVMKNDTDVEFSVTPDDLRGNRALRAVDMTLRSIESVRRELAIGGVTINLQGFDGSRELESPNVLMSWCISPELAANIKRQVVARNCIAKLLIVVGGAGVDHFDSRQFSSRKLVDIDDPMAVIGFASAGINRVAVAVVLGPSERYLKQLYMGTSRGGVTCGFYQTSLWDSLPSFGVASIVGTGYMQVDVPAELFAKKPFDWDWVNEFFESWPRDQCVFRKRRLFAYTVQPMLYAGIYAFVALKWLISLSIIAFLLLFGTRGLDYRPLRSPRASLPSDVYAGNLSSVFFKEVCGCSLAITFIFSPAFILMAVSFYFMPNLFGKVAMAFVLVCVSLGVTALTIVSVIVVLLPGTKKLLSRILAYFSLGKSLERNMEHERLKQVRMTEEMNQRIDAASCSGEGLRQPDVHSLPFTLKTVRFHAAALKQKVCRNFAV
jgi:hypothetical protein